MEPSVSVAVAVAVAATVAWAYAKFIHNVQPNVLTVLRLVPWFMDERRDLVGFAEKHKELFASAKASGDHFACTSHWYATMSTLISRFYGENFHFAPPSYRGQPLSCAFRDMHTALARIMRLAPGVRALDLGCGIGGLSRDLARCSGAFVDGITASAEEVEQAEAINKSEGLEMLCHVVQGDMQRLPFPDGSFDVVFGVYTLKYLTKLDNVFKEVRRVLKPGGRMLVECMQKSDKYNPEDPEHVELIQRWEYSCGMPTLHSTKECIAVAAEHGLPMLMRSNLSCGKLQWHSVFTENPLLLAVLGSSLIATAIAALEWLGVFVKGTSFFIKTFIANNVLSISKAGSMGILTGSDILVFEKPADAAVSVSPR